MAINKGDLVVVIGASEDLGMHPDEREENYKFKKTLLGRVLEVDIVFQGQIPSGHKYRISPKQTNYNDCFFTEEELEVAYSA